MDAQKKPTGLCHGALFFLRTSGFFYVYLYIYFCYLDRQVSSFTVLLKIKQALRRNLQSGHLGSK